VAARSVLHRHSLPRQTSHSRFIERLKKTGGVSSASQFGEAGDGGGSAQRGHKCQGAAASRDANQARRLLALARHEPAGCGSHWGWIAKRWADAFNKRVVEGLVNVTSPWAAMQAVGDAENRAESDR